VTATMPNYSDAAVDENSRDFLTFHRDEERHAAYLNPPSPLFDAASRTWMVIDPFDALALLAEPGMVAVQVSVAGLEARFGVELDHVGRIATQVPLYLEGKAHEAARRRITERIVARREPIRQWMEVDFAGYFEPLRQPGRVEVVADVVTRWSMVFLRHSLASIFDERRQLT